MISKSDELVQGVVDLHLPVLSILAVDEPSSFLSEDVWHQSVGYESRWGPLRAIFCPDASSWSLL